MDTNSPTVKEFGDSELNQVQNSTSFLTSSEKAEKKISENPHRILTFAKVAAGNPSNQNPQKPLVKSKSKESLENPCNFIGFENFLAAYQNPQNPENISAEPKSNEFLENADKVHSISNVAAAKQIPEKIQVF